MRPLDCALRAAAAPPRSRSNGSPPRTHCSSGEAALLAVAGLRGRLAFRIHRGALPALGLALVAYAVVYPVLGALAGHGWPRTPVFGLAPCPNTIFTFGVLLLSERAVPRWLLAIPLLPA